MFKVDYEFRKGILFIRLRGNLTKNSYAKNEDLITTTYDIGCNYVALNLDEVKSIDIYGINYISAFYEQLNNNHGLLVLCDKNKNISTHIFNRRIPYVDNELDLFKVV